MKTKDIIASIRTLANSKKIHILTLVLAILFVVVTSVFVAYKSSIIHSYNHDNLIDSYMFNSYEDFKSASFPASHTFLLKWPFFALSGALGNSTSTFIILAVTLYLLTVIGIVSLIIVICKKKVLISALCITIYGLILLLIPAQSSPGVLAPVNMGMITTRNIEYLAYILFFFLIHRSTKLVSLPGILAVLTMIILGLSDKLFLLMALTAGVLNVVHQFNFASIKGKEHFSKSLNPLIYIGTAYISVTIVSVLINMLNITHIYEPLSSAPFDFVASVSQAQTAFEWAIQATLVNIGINPFGNSIGIKTLPYFINGVFLILAIFASVKLYLNNARLKSDSESKEHFIGYWLFLSTIAAFIIYTFSNHYLENDLRYMGIVTFSAIISITIFLSRDALKELSNMKILITIAMLLLSSPLFVVTARSGLNKDLEGTKSVFESRFINITNTIKKYDVKVLVAEYWNTSPVRYRMNNTIQTAPIMGTPCISKNYFLTSFKWYKPENIHDKSALYIVKGKSPESDKCLTDLALTLGQPVHIAKMNSEGTDELWVYNYDIRSKLKW